MPAQDDRQVEELELEVTRLMEEVDRYRKAADAALAQVDWCIGYFTGKRQGGIAQSLTQSRAEIPTRVPGRADQPLPLRERETGEPR